jgi:hypothetical protein
MRHRKPLPHDGSFLYSSSLAAQAEPPKINANPATDTGRAGRQCALIR